MNTIEQTAKQLEIETEHKATDLAVVAMKTASDLAIATARTNAEIKTDMGWVKESLSRVEQTLGEMRAQFITTVQHKEVCDELLDHEKRLRKINDNIQLWAGGLVILVFAVPILLKIFIKN